MNDWVGKTLGNVRIDSLIARGGMAEVYAGTHTTLQRTVAVKFLRNTEQENSDTLERFEREARVVAKLRHPNIVQVFDFSTVDGLPYLVMEYVKGPSLSRYLHVLHRNMVRLELSQTTKLVTAVASALQYAHESGVIHRDVKPGNIILTSRSKTIKPGDTLPLDFEPVLTDFGLVRFLDSSRQTSTGQISGTPAYMSPEQARGEITDGRTDIYSLGVVLYEMLAGYIPFDGETTMSILLKHVTEPPAPIPALHPYLQAVLDRALAKDRNERYQMPTEFADAFNKAFEQQTKVRSALAVETPTIGGIPSQPVARVPAQPKPKTGRRWGFAVLAGVLVILLGSFLFANGFSFLRSTPTPTIKPPADTETPVEATPIPVDLINPLGTTGFIHFQNGGENSDQVKLTAQAMPSAPEGSQYEVWLIGSGERLSLGILELDGSGRGELIFVNDQGTNLVARYDTVEVTIEPDPDNDSNSSGRVAYSFTMSTDTLSHIRYLLVASPNTPNGSSLVDGLSEHIRMINEFANEMQKANDNGNETLTQQNAEAILNLILGEQNPDHMDWNNDGRVTNPGDGYGLLLNGSHLGYIQAVYSEVDFAINTPGTIQRMIASGENVKTCVQNLAQWTPQLRELLVTILTSAPGSDNSQTIEMVVVLTDQMLNGIDLDKDGVIITAVGECGMEDTYEFAYSMADMPLLPVNQPDSTTSGDTQTPSPTAGNVTIVPTNTSGGGNGGSTPQPGHTPPGQINTKKPKPTQKNNKK